MERVDMPKFNLAAVDEVHLDRVPLANVLMQVQFSRTPQLVTDAAEERLADALARYPVRRRQVSAGGFPNVVINGQQVNLPGAITPGVALAFSNPQSTWQVTVTDTAVALQTTDYSSRDDFCERVGEVLQAVADVALPPVVDRVGVRYIDRFIGDQLQQVGRYVIPELGGLLGCVDPPVQLHQSVTESHIQVSAEDFMLVRSGLLPQGIVFDPALPPVAEPSWILDMDTFSTQAGFAFIPAELTERTRRYAEAAYSFFRFATTSQFEDDHRDSVVDRSNA